MFKQKNISFIGGGMIAQIGHIPFYLEDKRCKIVSIYETRPSLKKYFKTNFEKIDLITDYKKILENSRIDAVIICTPREVNSYIGYESVIAGKNVFTEKPMAYTYGQSLKIHNKVLEKKVLYGLGFMKRFDSGLLLAKKIFREALNSGKFGQIKQIYFFSYDSGYQFTPPAHKRPEESRDFRFNSWKSIPNSLSVNLVNDYKNFMNSGIHTLNLLNFFLDQEEIKLLKVNKTKNDLKVEMEFKGIPVFFDFIKINKKKWLDGVKFEFTDSIINVEIPCPMNTVNFSKVTITKNHSVKENIVADDYTWPFKLQAKNFVDSLFGIDNLKTDSFAGLKDMKIVEKIWSNI